MISKEERCQVDVKNNWSSYQCQKKAITEIEGKRYCWVHNPENVKEREDKSRKKWEKEDRDFRYERSAVEYCKTQGLSLKELETFVNEGGEE